MDYKTWDLGQWIVIGLSIVLIVWYVIAGYLNRKKGIQIYRWLREGLETLGEVSNVHWIGSSGSGGQINLISAAPPFQSLEATFLLASREILPLWLFNLYRGKRDELILKADLRQPPALEIEVARKGDKEFSRLLALEQKLPFSQLPAPEGYQLAYRGRKKPGKIENLEGLLEMSLGMVRKISLQRKKTHLVLLVSLAELPDHPAGDFFTSLQYWLQNL